MQLDNSIHLFWNLYMDDRIIWRQTKAPWISYYNADSLYVLRDMRHAWPSFAFVYADSPEEAVDFMLSQGGWKQTIQLVEKKERPL